MAKEPKYKSEKSKKRATRRKNPFFGRPSGKLYLPTRYPSPPIYKSEEIEIIQAPKKFSIIGNSKTMLNFFNSFHSIMDSGHDIFIDMQKVTTITEDAILYLLSRLDYFMSIFPDRHISGNFPKDTKCKQLLIESRFTKYVKTQRTYSSDQTNIFPIIQGEFSDGKIVSNLLNYVESKIGLSIENSSRVYGSIMELMQNTREHAFTGSEKSLKKWWLIALPEIKNNKKIIHFTLLDNGVGIPQTVEKKNNEYIKSIIPGLSSDSDILLSTLRGEFRTQTLQRERGKGLPSVYEISKLRQIENMVILSRKGYVKIGSYEKEIEIKNINPKFYGTLFSWDFVS